MIVEDNYDNFIILNHDFSNIAGKHNQGGQSAQRFERNREECLKHWYKDTADIINTKLQQGIDGRLILAGPSRTKNKVIPYIKSNIKIEVFNCEYCNECGIYELRKKLK